VRGPSSTTRRRFVFSTEVILAIATEAALHDLDDAWRLTTADHPIPYSPTLEDAFLPLADVIVSGVRARLGVAAPA
jgi:pyruvate/2-oxoglutarate/acetoin dehydrogenase E1 component